MSHPFFGAKDVCYITGPGGCPRNDAGSSFCASRLNATRRMSTTELVCAVPSQQRLLAAPSQQHYNLALNWNCNLQLATGCLRASSRPSSRCCGQHLDEVRGGTSRGDARCAQHQLRRSSRSSVAAAEAPSQQQKLRRSSRITQKQATAVSRDQHER